VGGFDGLSVECFDGNPVGEDVATKVGCNPGYSVGPDVLLGCILGSAFGELSPSG